MSRSADVVALSETVKANDAIVDVLVNNAGIAVFEMVANLTEEAFHRQVDINPLCNLCATSPFAPAPTLL